MGVPHLDRIEWLLKRSSEPVSLYFIRKELLVNRLVALEALDYLVKKKLVRFKEGRYSWRKK